MWKMNGEAHRSQMWEKKSLDLEMRRRWLKCIEVIWELNEWFIAEGVKESEESKTASQPGLPKETKQTSQARGKLNLTVYDAQVSYSSQKRCHQNDVIRIILWLNWKRLLFVNWVFFPPKEINDKIDVWVVLVTVLKKNSFSHFFLVVYWHLQ